MQAGDAGVLDRYVVYYGTYARSHEALDEDTGFQEEVRNAAHSIPGDPGQEAFCQQLVAEAIQKLGGLDILACNASFAAGNIYGSGGGQGQP